MLSKFDGIPAPTIISCTACGRDSKGFYLCQKCLNAGKTPTYRRCECISCGKVVLIPWDETPRITCGARECYMSAVARMARHDERQAA